MDGLTLWTNLYGLRAHFVLLYIMLTYWKFCCSSVTLIGIFLVYLFKIMRTEKCYGIDSVVSWTRVHLVARFVACWNHDHRESHKWLILSFCPKFLGRWWGPMSAILSAFEYSLSCCSLLGGGDTQTLTNIIEFVWRFHTQEVVGMLKHCFHDPLSLRCLDPNKPPSETLIT